MEAMRTGRGLYRAAEAAGVHGRTISRERERDPAFNDAVLDALQYHADVLEEAMETQAEKTGNPVGYIVRLKALRPAQYIEKHAVMNLNVTANVEGADAMALLSQLVRELSPAIHHGLTETTTETRGEIIEATVSE